MNYKELQKCADELIEENEKLKEVIDRLKNKLVMVTGQYMRDVQGVDECVITATRNRLEEELKR